MRGRTAALADRGRRVIAYDQRTVLDAAAIAVGPRTPAWIVERSQELTSSIPPATIDAAGRLILRFDVSDRIGAIRTPTTVICGRAGRLTPLRGSVRLAERIPAAHLDVVAGAGHMVMLEDPARLEELVLGARVPEAATVP